MTKEAKVSDLRAFNTAKLDKIFQLFQEHVIVRRHMNAKEQSKKEIM